MDSKDLFKNMEGLEHFKNQLTDVPVEKRDDCTETLINFIVSGFMV